jgi:hypothetical protein
MRWDCFGRKWPAAIGLRLVAPKAAAFYAASDKQRRVWYVKQLHGQQFHNACLTILERSKP